MNNSEMGGNSQHCYEKESSALDTIEKEEKLKNIGKQIDKTNDGLGLEIDIGIKKTIVILNAIGISTTGSCEGHLDWGLPWPWIDIASPNEPKEKYKGQLQTFENLARSKGLDPQEYWKRPQKITKKWMEKWECLYSLWTEALVLSDKNSKKTTGYEIWARENKKLHTKITDLIEEFYSKKSVSKDVKIIVGKFYGDDFRISFSDENLGIKYVDKELSAQKTETMKGKLPQRQAEMKAFTKFLEKKYWE